MAQRFLFQRCNFFDFEGVRWIIVISNASIESILKTIETKSLLSIDKLKNQIKDCYLKEFVARLPRF